MINGNISPTLVTKVLHCAWVKPPTVIANALFAAEFRGNEKIPIAVPVKGFFASSAETLPRLTKPLASCVAAFAFAVAG
ncbi:Uncharacterised protein [Vibrio cholerae]|nr:Uncharacterised protein [Vibrio cholerae]